MIKLVANKTNDGKYTTDIVYNEKIVATNVQGEFNLILENEDRSHRERIVDFKATKIIEDKDSLVLVGEHFIKMLDTTIEFKISYNIINETLVEKKIELVQRNIPLLFFSIETELTPKDEPKAYWSFDNLNHLGGVVREVYPAGGFRSADDISVGILLDAGHRNLWTRNIRRRPHYNKIGFAALQEICDVNLYNIPKISGEGVKVTLGEAISYNNGMEKEILTIYGIKETNELAETVMLKDGFYNISFDYQSSGNISVKVFRDKYGKKVLQSFDYQDGIPGEIDEWKSFSDSFLLNNTEGYETLIKVFLTNPESDGTIELKNFKVTQIEGKSTPYHRMNQGEPIEKKYFIFCDDAEYNFRNIRYKSQTNLAAGLGLQDLSDVEKILFADMQMLTWITSKENFEPLNVPSINYAPDMYNRDSFWSIAAIHDKYLSQKVFNSWGATQTQEGGIGTIITPAYGSVEVKGNEATCEWIWWAYINKTRYGIEPDMNKIQKAFDFCINEFDPDKTGLAHSHFVLGQNDVQTYFENGKTTDISVNQGVWAVTLKVAKALGLAVDDYHIENAVQYYRDFYSPELKFFLNHRKCKNAISVGDFMPEFVSIWLLNETMLNKEMVINTLDKLPVFKDCSPFIGDIHNIYFNTQNSPFDEHFHWQDGQYYNGGSWLREEIMAYVVGAVHGYEKAAERIEKRLNAEINISPDDPVSHEFIALNHDEVDTWWPSIRVFSWNVFVLKALEVYRKFVG
ncbi:MAG: hypothetical protein Q8934_11995 [Bacillota bacterium]|nr:hypothetical protein [Bacillota bacterium]